MDDPWFRASSVRASLKSLLDEVVRARAHQHEQTELRGVSIATQVAGHRAVLEALERYVGALEANELPIPRRIQADLRLRRALCGLPVNLGAVSTMRPLRPGDLK